MIKKHIPNLFTTGNLMMGFFSVIQTLEGNYKNAALFILIGMLLDAFDGRLARIFNVQNDFGKELDSLADVVTFGVAPAIILYTTLFHAFSVYGMIFCSLIPVCGALRLARFNTETHKVSNYFIGLPITACGGILATFSFYYESISVYVYAALILILSFMMVSNVRYPNFKKISIPRNAIYIIPLMVLITILVMKFIPSFSLLLLFSPVFIYFVIRLYRFFKKENDTLFEENEE